MSFPFDAIDKLEGFGHTRRTLHIFDDQVVEDISGQIGGKSVEFGSGNTG
ncbi:MAG: hypothetical protein H6557_11610 [Lewinellaceae bacterium]|nr:hypothetical protein [Lewinellaceae bacterium]